jgi:hypothetical protein
MQLSRAPIFCYLGVREFTRALLRGSMLPLKNRQTSFKSFLTAHFADMVCAGFVALALR